jgi:hypothetical protein
MQSICAKRGEIQSSSLSYFMGRAMGGLENLRILRSEADSSILAVDSRGASFRIYLSATS